MGKSRREGPPGRDPKGCPPGRACRVSEWGEVAGTGLSGGVGEVPRLSGLLGQQQSPREEDRGPCGPSVVPGNPQTAGCRMCGALGPSRPCPPCPPCVNAPGSVLCIGNAEGARWMRAAGEEPCAHQGGHYGNR